MCSCAMHASSQPTHDGALLRRWSGQSALSPTTHVSCHDVHVEKTLLENVATHALTSEGHNDDSATLLISAI